MELAGVSDASGKASQSRIGAIIWALIFNGTYLFSPALNFAKCWANARSRASQKARERRWVHAKQAGCVSSRFPPPGDHPNNFSLLLIIQLWRSPANPPLPAGSLQTNFRTFAQHRPFELGQAGRELSHRKSSLFEQLAGVNDADVSTHLRWEIPFVAGDDEIGGSGEWTSNKVLVGGVGRRRGEWRGL